MNSGGGFGLPGPAVPTGLHGFALFTALATLGLLGVGGLVTSHGVGMAVPDWPNTYGYNMFFFPFSQWVGGVLYEHSHRLVASAVGLLTTMLALWLYGRKSRLLLRWAGLSLVSLGLLTGLLHRWSDATVLGLTGLAGLGASFVWLRSEPAPRWLRRLGLLALVAVVLQGVLGGLRVTQMKDELGIFHGTLAQMFFVLMCAIALFTSPWFARSQAWLHGAPDAVRARVGWLVGLATVFIFTQLVLGATMRHQHAGLAIPDFPLAYSKVWPDTDLASVERYNQQRLEIVAVNPITRAHILLQMAHRIAAFVIFFAVTVCAWSFCRIWGMRNPASRLALLWCGLIGAQILLGAATIWSEKAADIATAHVMVGALSLAAGAILCIVTFQTSEGARERTAASGALPADPAGDVPRLNAIQQLKYGKSGHSNAA